MRSMVKVHCFHQCAVSIVRSLKPSIAADDTSSNSQFLTTREHKLRSGRAIFLHLNPLVVEIPMRELRKSDTLPISGPSRAGARMLRESPVARRRSIATVEAKYVLPHGELSEWTSLGACPNRERSNDRFPRMHKRLRFQYMCSHSENQTSVW